MRYRAAGAGNRDITDIAEAPRFVAGVKGSVVGWDFDTALLYSESKVREQINGGYPAYTKILPLLNSGTVNFFGPSTPDVDAALLATNFVGDAFRIKSSLTSVAANGSRDVDASCPPDRSAWPSVPKAARKNTTSAPAPRSPAATSPAMAATSST